MDGAVCVGLMFAPSGWFTPMGRVSHGHLWLGKAKPFEEGWCRPQEVPGGQGLVIPRDPAWSSQALGQPVG